MVSGTSRRIAVPMVFACLGVLGAAEAAHAEGGLSVTPAVLERRARMGNVGSLTLNNTTNESLRVTVNVRPVAAGAQRQGDRRRARDLQPLRARHAPLVHDPRRREGARQLPDGPPHSESAPLYGSVDILGKPTRTKGRKGIIPQYRLICSLRLHPGKKTLKLRTGAGAGPQRHVRAAGPQPRQHDRAGHGTYRLSGAGSRSGQLESVRSSRQAGRRWA